MAGIYNRDNINYSNIMDNFIKNRNERAKIAADNIRKQGEIWSGAVKNLADIGTRAYDAYQAEEEADELEKKLKELEERRDYIRAQYTSNQDYNKDELNRIANAQNSMKDYTPEDLTYAAPQRDRTMPYTYVENSAMSKWLQDHPGKTEDDYNEYVKYMNAIYGGV